MLKHRDKAKKRAFGKSHWQVLFDVEAFSASRSSSGSVRGRVFAQNAS